jgi:hypothetical protein
VRKLPIKLYRIYVCYTNIRLYIEFGISAVSRNRGRSWKVLPVNTGALLYTCETEIVLSNRVVRLRIVTFPSRQGVDQSILLDPAETRMVPQVIPHTTAVLSSGVTHKFISTEGTSL